MYEPIDDIDDFEDSEDSGDSEDFEDTGDGSFSVTNQVWPISGNKIHSLLLDDECLRFSGRRFKFAEGFEAAWQKKWSTATKLRISYQSIRSITKEDGELQIRIVYKTSIGIPGECAFSFFDAVVCHAFLDYMEKEQYFTYTHERMLAFKAISRYLLGLLFTIAMTWTCCYLITDKANGTADDDGDVKARLFLYLLRLLGEKGIVAIGIGICGYIGFKIWKRAGDPPTRVKLARA
jgi:hypothetical protein